MSSSSLPVLVPRLIAGLETNVKGNIHFLTDDEVIYPVGAVVTVHNPHVKKQKFIKLSDKGKNLTHIALSPDKKLIAIVETTDKYPIATLWDSETFRKKRTLTLPTDKEIIASRYVAVDFTYNSKNIILVTGEPDWSLYSFKCDKGRLESFARANNNNNTGTVMQIACNPNDQNQIALVGDLVLRCLGCVDYAWRQYGYNKFDGATYTSCCWLSQDRLMVGSNKGKLLILETGEIRAVFHAMDLPVINMKLKDELEQGSQTSLKSPSDSVQFIEDDDENYEIRSIHNFPRGFAFGFMNGRIHLYERDTPHKFRKRSVLRIPNKTIYREYDDGPKEIKTTINCIIVNAAQDRLVATCNETQIYHTRIWLQQECPLGQELPMYEFAYPLHLGPIGSMSLCRWKPICISSGKRDRSLKIWNYETNELELVQNFEDDIYSVALHPTGLYCVIGFTDKLRYMTIMIDDMITTKEFSIRSCKLSSFSRMGHLFASTNRTIIHIYSSISFELMFTLKGHNGNIECMSWSKDDRQLATCGSEGAVYVWDVCESSRISETIIKSNPFTGVAITQTGKEVYAVGNDGHIRELINSNVYRDVVLVPPAAGGLDAVILSQLDSMLFVAGNQGSIYSIKVPLLEKAEFTEFIMHKRTIVQLHLSYDDRFLISGAEDGSICFWKLINTEEKAIKLDKEISSSSEILISREILEDKMDQIKNLHLRLKELETEHSYQMRQNDALHSLKMRDIHSEYCHAIEELKIKNEQMEGDHIQEINSINSQIAKMKADHELFVQKLEASYNEKLIVEYKKFMRFEEKMNRMLKEHEQNFEALKKAKAESEESITNSFLEIVKDKDNNIEELKEKVVKLIKEHELIKQQIEDDCDREIYELKCTHEKDIKEEQDLNVKLRGEAAVIKKKLLATQKEADDYKHQTYVLENDHIKFKSIINGLEKDIIDIKKEITERDATIEDKEKRIFQLKSKNQELEKFKFILDFKIKELKSQIEPRERTIQEQVIQINEMVRELENLQKVILNLDTQMAEGRAKLTASVNEVRKEMEKNRVMKKALQAIRMDIHHASGFIQNVPVLQKVVKEMYHKYNADKDFEVSQAEDTEAKSEFLRQRDFLERTVATLHAQATKNTSTLSFDKVRLVDENATLLVETNQLRKSLQSEINQNRKLNSIIGLSYVAPKAAQKKVNLAVSTNEEIHNKYKETINKNRITIEALVEENERLLNKIAESEEWESRSLEDDETDSK
ncbi:cilia- and flagella-associated protein 57 [Anthonomus grandis grandis]|uniref:cilia- and flagella-associated protein 57 n=1 Tax=Anthonomus grandis grandis TaxID=2921223 RepID=UPI00216505B9|nr:cilia- and flagella-associated protein 57 [Anthonomus grandis grandis]